MEGKGDGGKKEQKGGASPSMALGMPKALFPRLHVSETERAGPRAPPRNKMALYEQFTIPSQQRLVPPSVAVDRFGHPYAHQFFSEQQYPYYSHDMIRAFAYTSTNGTSYFASQPSLPLCTSATTCMVDSDGGQHTSRNPSGVRLGSGRTMLTAQAGSSHQRSPGKKSKLDVHNRLHSLSSEKVKITEQNMHALQLSENPRKSLEDSFHITIPAVSIQSSQVLESHGNASVPGSTRTEILDVVIQGCVNVKKKDGKRDKELSGIFKSEGQINQASSKGDRFAENIAGFQEISSKQASAKSDQQNTSNQHNNFDEKRLNSGSIGDCPGSKSVSGNACQFVNKTIGLSMNNIKSSATERSCSSLPDQAADAQQELIKSTLENSLKSGKHILKLRQQSNMNGNSYESKNMSDLSKGGGKNLQMTQMDQSKYSEFTPKDIMQVVGQQFFWQARINILRQQQIFSDQVFELHKLTQVQQMLASTPIEVEISHSSSSMMLKCDASSVIFNSQKNRGQTADLKPQKNRNSPFEDPGGHCTEQEIQLKVPCDSRRTNHDRTQLSNYDIYEHIYTDPCPSLPAVVPAGACAWGVPHPGLGSGQWITPTAAWPGAFVFQSFIDHTPASPAFHGGYNYGTRPAVSLSSSFKLPGYNHQAECSQDTYPMCRPLTFGKQLKPTCYSQGVPYSLASSYTKEAQSLESAKRVSINQNQKELLPVSEPSKTQESGKCRKTSIGPFSSLPDTIFQSQCIARPSGSNDFNGSPCKTKKTFTSGGTFLNVGISLSMPCSHDEQAEHGNLGLEHQGLSGLHAGPHLVDDGRCSLSSEEMPGKASERTTAQREADSKDQLQNSWSRFPVAPALHSKEHLKKCPRDQTEVQQNRVIKAVPHSAFAASKSAAGILLSIQKERQR